MIPSNLAKSNFYVSNQGKKKCVLHVKLTFETILIFYMNSDALFLNHILETIYASVIDTVISEKIFFYVCNHDNNRVLSPILTLGTTPFFL